MVLYAINHYITSNPDAGATSETASDAAFDVGDATVTDSSTRNSSSLERKDVFRVAITGYGQT